MAPGAYRGLPMSMSKLFAGLAGVLLSAAVVTILIGVGTEVKAQLAPAFVQDNRPDPVPSGCAQEPWPYGCQWRAPVKRVFIRGPRPE
jgi:hypothetical protein